MERICDLHDHVMLRHFQIGKLICGELRNCIVGHESLYPGSLCALVVLLSLSSITRGIIHQFFSNGGFSQTNKTIIPLMLVVYELMVADSVLRTSPAI